MFYKYALVVRHSEGVAVLEIEETRIIGLEKQIGFLKSKISKESKRNTILFLLGLTIGLLSNVIIEILQSISL